MCVRVCAYVRRDCKNKTNEYEAYTKISLDQLQILWNEVNWCWLNVLISVCSILEYIAFLYELRQKVGFIGGPTR